MTWPTSTVASSRSFACCTSRYAQSRTWVTEPGAPGRSGSRTVWIESSANTSGRTDSTCATTCGSEVSETTSRLAASAPSRSARIRTCALDSSAVTSRQRAPSSAMLPRACRSRVLLPIPGSPASSVTDPGTRPPSSTRSSSGSSGGARRRRVHAHRADRHRRVTRCQARACRGRRRILHQRAPRLTRRAATQPARRLAAALGATVDRSLAASSRLHSRDGTGGV